jgi:hypothetical protein
MSSNKKLQGASGFLNLSGSLNVEDLFSAFVYLGNGSARTITNGIDLSNEGGLVWTKNRGSSANHCFFDTTTGTQKFGSSNLSSGFTDIGAQAYQFNDDGYRFLNSNVDNPRWNATANEYVSWTFRKAPKFFDIVTYTGNGSNQNISHNLGATPGFVIVKKISSGTGNWSCWHRSLTSGYYIILNSTNAQNDGGAGARTVNDTTYQIFGSFADEGSNGETYVMYLFGHDTSDEGLIQCGTVDIDGSSNATVNLGFEPQWALLKTYTAASNWEIHDTLRGWSLNTLKAISPDVNVAEQNYNATYSYVTSTGFETTGYFSGSQKLLYVAVRRGPMATPTTRASVFNEDTSAYSGADASIPAFGVANFADFLIAKDRTTTEAVYINARIQGNNALITNGNSTEVAGSGVLEWDYMTGAWVNAQSNNRVAYVWSRAPGFCDVVIYTGNGSAGRQINHNLGATPEMIWLKLRGTYTDNWVVYHKDLTSGHNIFLNTNGASANYSSRLYSPSSTIFTVSSDTSVNSNSLSYIAFLFATLPGISKVGSFSHTNGSSTDVACGFSAGCRWVMVKRTDSTGDWYVWDSEHGIRSNNNNPHILLNSDAAEVTNDPDLIDPLTGGFQMTSDLPTGDYIFYAIAA